MREPNSQKQILGDLPALIEKSREEGFEQVSLTMDVNDNYQYARDIDKYMQIFIRDAQLVDPFYETFKIPLRIYLWEKKRINLALVDLSSAQVICRIGYLKTHEGTDSNRMLGYIDWDQHMFSQGLVTRPVRMQERSIRIKQTDKIKIKHSLETLIPKVVHQHIHQRIIDLAQSLIEHGPNPINENNYSRVYLEMVDLMQRGANEVGKMKIGYMHARRN